MYQTGTNHIDTLLVDSQPHWSGNGSFDSPETVSFSFVPTIAAYNNTSGVVPVSDFFAFRDSQKEAARLALQLWANVANLTFFEVGDSTASHGNIRFLNSLDIEPAAGQAFLPDVPVPGDKNFFESSGDVSINDFSPGNLDFSEHGFGLSVLVHEIGHALGLNHPNSSDSLATIPDGQNSDRFTVMATPETGGDRVFELADVFATGPMIFDIAAIQHLYGANTSFHSGNDTYFFDDNDLVFEAIWDGGGNDTISVSGSTFRAIIDLRDGHMSSVVGSPSGSGFAATDNLGIAFDAIIENAIGGNQNDVITGNTVNNRLSGQGGGDTLKGLGGGDSLLGGGGNDSLVGGGGGDDLNGGTGVDRLIGGTGSDTYFVDGSGDTIIEDADAGADEVVSTASFVLPGNVENLTLGGSAVDGVGNGLGNAIVGNGAVNTLAGAGGNDVLTGDAGADRLVGGSGADTMVGGAGVDTMVGGGGNDRYVVNGTGETVVELFGEGADRVVSSVSFGLSANVEDLTLKGTGDIDGTGNGLNNDLTGNSGDNVLEGAAGADTIFGNGGLDTIVGGTGSDVLQGDGGADAFVYRSLTHGAAVGTDTTRGVIVGDTIADFAPGTDVFDFVASAFDPAGDIGLGTLTLGNDFSVIAAQYNGTNPGTNANHAAGEATFVFSTADDTLYYDADGTTTAGYVVVATLDNGATLTAGDIQIVA